MAGPININRGGPRGGFRQPFANAVPIVGVAAAPVLLDRLGREVRAGDLVMLTELSAAHAPAYRVLAIEELPRQPNQPPEVTGLKVIFQTEMVIAIQAMTKASGVVLIHAEEEKAPEPDASPAPETPPSGILP